MNYDDYITGLHDDNSPMNRKEELSEIEELQLEYESVIESLKNRLRESWSKSRYQASLLKEAGGIFELYRMTGNITEKEMNRLSEIFEPYISTETN